MDNCIEPYLSAVRSLHYACTWPSPYISNATKVSPTGLPEAHKIDPKARFYTFWDLRPKKAFQACRENSSKLSNASPTYLLVTLVSLQGTSHHKKTWSSFRLKVTSGKLANPQACQSTAPHLSYLFSFPNSCTYACNPLARSPAAALQTNKHNTPSIVSLPQPPSSPPLLQD